MLLALMKAVCQNRINIPLIEVNTDYSITYLWLSRIVSQCFAIPLRFESSPGGKFKIHLFICCKGAISSYK